MKKINDKCLRIEPIDNGWIVRVTEHPVDYGGGIPCIETHVFINEKELGRFVEDFYTKKS